jgi:hypothetical protein
METTTNRSGVIKWIEPVKSYDEITQTSRKIPNKRVYICSPLRGSQMKYNIKNACAYCRFAFESGFVPIAPHIYFPQFLNENNGDERAAGLRYGMEEMYRCVQLWVFGPHRSMGMKAEIELANDLGIPVRYFTESMEELRI